MKWIFRLCVVLFLYQCGSNSDFKGKQIKFNNNWYFIKQDSVSQEVNYLEDFDKSNWKSVQLPHTPKVEPRIVNNQWQGISWYKKVFALNNSHMNKKLFIKFEGAMNIAEVWINGKKKITHHGGYLSFAVDISDDVEYTKENVLTVKLNNLDNPVTGPKPLGILDFNTYGGIYRNVWFISKNKIHITNPILENKVASGGVFVSYPKVTDTSAEIKIQTHVRNSDVKDAFVAVRNILMKDGIEVVSTSS